MSTEIIWQFGIVLIVIIAIVVYRIKFVLISSSKLNELIQNYYKSDQYEILLVRKLTMNEKFRYRESSNISMFMTFGQTGYNPIPFFKKPNESYFRVIELKDSNDNEYQIYTEIVIANQEIDEIIEFDSYEL